MKKFLHISLVLIAIFALLVCATACSDAKYDAAEESGMAYSSDMLAKNAAPIGTTSSLRIILPEDNTRLIVYRVSVSLTVEDLLKSIDSITALCKEYDGFLMNTTIEGDGAAYLTYKIPNASLQEYLDKLTKQGEVERQSISGEDITDRYTDAQREKESLERLIAEYEKMYEETTKTSDRLTIRKEINTLNSQIADWDRTIDSYEKESKYATVNISLYEEGTYEEPSYWDKLGETFFGSGRSIGTLFGGILTALVAIIPYIGLLAVIFGLYVLIKFIVCRIRKIPFSLFKNLRARRAIRKAKKKAALASAAQQADQTAADPSEEEKEPTEKE